MAETRTVAARLRNVRLTVGDGAGLGAGLPVPAVFRGEVIRWPADPLPAHRIDGLICIEWLHVTAQSAGWLRRFAAAASFPARRVTMVVDSWRKPQTGWSGRVGMVPGLVRHEVRLPTGNSGRAVVDLTLAEPLPVGQIVAAALDALVPRRPVPSVVSADLTAGDRIPRQRLSADAAPGPAVRVDASVANPIGRSAIDPARTARLRFGSEGVARRWWLGPDGGIEPAATGRLDLSQLDDAQLAAIRSVGVVECELAESVDPAGEAGLLVQLAATGTVVHARHLPLAVEDLICPELTKIVLSPLPGRHGDPIEWEFRSVGQRRAALRDHAAGLRPAGVRAVSRPPTVSVLLVTMRPHELPKVIEAMAAQTYPELEIVVGLHGCELVPDAERVLASCGRQVEVIDIPNTMTLGEALGAVTALARGDLVTKVDDDDVYGSEHIWDLVIAREFSGAALVGKGAEFVYLEALGVTVRRSAMTPETYSTVVAGGTILMARGELAAMGGWRPVPHSVDRALFDRVLREGGLIYRTHPLGYVYRRHVNGHTWDPGLEYFLRDSGPQWSGLPPFAEFVGGGR